MNKLISQLKQLNQFLEKGHSENPAVSRASVGWHMDHILLVLIKVLSELEQSNPKAYKWLFNKRRFIVFLLNRIPYKGAKAPEAVKPTNDFDSEKTKILLNKPNTKH